MKIAHIISGLEEAGGGGTAAVLSMAQWQQRLGHQCTIYTTGEADTVVRGRMLTDFGGDVIAFDRVGPRFLRYTPEFRKYINQHQPQHDIFVMHSSYQYPVFAASLFCRERQIPYIFMPHGSLDPSVRQKHPIRNRLIDFAYHDAVLRGASAWHFTSIGEMEKCERKIWKSFFIQHLGIDVDNFRIGRRSNAFRLRHAIPEEATLFLFLSRITRKKGVKMLLDEFLRVASDRQDVYLALCGPIEPDQEPFVKAAQSDEAAGSRVVTSGFITGEEKRAAYLDSDYFVLPTYGENFGFAVFEALAYGLPVITTTAFDMHAKLSETDRVKIISPDGPSLRGAIADILASGWKPTSSVDEMREWLHANFSWQASATSTLKLYDVIVKAAVEEAGALSARVC